MLGFAEAVRCQRTQEDRGREAYHGRTADLWMEVYDEPIRIISNLLFQILSESCEQKNADRRVIWIYLVCYANAFPNVVQTKAHEVIEEKLEEKIASVQLSAPDTSQEELVP